MGDPSDILPPSEIEAIVGDYQARVGQVPLNATERNVGRLLAHLRALTGSADGEALGREAFFADMPGGDYERLPPMSRCAYQRIGLHLHAIGHAAGALSREGEIARLTAELAEARLLTHLLSGSRTVCGSSAYRVTEVPANVTCPGCARADGAREERRFLLAEDSPFPVLDVLTALADAADHAHDAHDCDHIGYEDVRANRDAAREIVRRIRARGGR